jgi:hypothetical protein
MVGAQVQAASSGMEEILHPRLVDAVLRDVREHTESERPLEGHAVSVASTAEEGPQALNAADNSQATYLQPLKISETVIETLANVWATLLGRK